MAVMRSVMYVPANNEKMIAKSPELRADILTLDIEDSVPPDQKAAGREMVKTYIESKKATQKSKYLYVRMNNWETDMPNYDLEAVVYPGLDGICLPKCRGKNDVQRLDWKLEELEQRRGIPVGSIAIQVLIETAIGVIHAYESATASPRVNSLIFGAVDYTKDMRVTLTSEGTEQMYARSHTAVAARAAGIIAIDAPFVAFKDVEAFKKNTRDGHQLGYEGRMLIHPSQIQVAHEIYTPTDESVQWAQAIKKIFEEEGLAKGIASVTYEGRMVDTPVYENALQILRTMEEIRAADKK